MDHHILIVDDEQDIRKIIRLQLSGTRFEILEAEGAEQAIELLKANALTVDVIICDVRMPKISGVEAVDYFRRNFPSTPVLVLTGFPDLNLAVEFMKEGVLDYLVKPVEKEKLIEAVENAASQRKIFE
jgi:two-component system chemotaxis response regulator CheY